MSLNEATNGNASAVATIHFNRQSMRMDQGLTPYQEFPTMDVNNPLLDRSGYPGFDRIQPQHVQPAVQQILEEARRIVADLEKATDVSWESLMGPLEEIDLLFEYGWSPVTHLLSVRNSDELRKAHEAVLPQIIEFRLQLRQSEPIYRQLLSLRNGS
ncbi:MAG: hypothetical protein KDA77_24005, partial [Planctomycetaceae bacterium]|nr:hypothetical protein [Planctomycetaceae bacterium]